MKRSKDVSAATSTPVIKVLSAKTGLVSQPQITGSILQEKGKTTALSKVPPVLEQLCKELR